ncbi:hypothetical protein IM511_06590 [Erythrobacteraceae bacterium E2-1 Yellow Sea]|nr:hypothetical protein [Erythrobacteraceae bacterium E2-1 Yellow Sea]
MVEDPYTYDLTEFGREFTWAIMFWNLTEEHTRWMLSGILGGHTAMHALVADLGSRSLAEALRSAARGMEDHPIRPHVEHFCAGYQRLGEYRNLYVHGLRAFDVGAPDENMVRPLSGRIMVTKGRGRLRTTNDPLPTEKIVEFKDQVRSLHEYGRAISERLGFDDGEVREFLGMPSPSLEMPQWPAAPKSSIHYIQD